MNNPPQAPELHFFRATPPDLNANPPLASSLQSLETCFMLVGYARYPHALLSCASAIESAIRAKLKLPADDRTSFGELIETIRGHPHNLKAHDARKLDEFRDARNRIVHYGFSPEDDQASVRLLLHTGLPFLSKCYQRLFDFYLDWRDVRPGVQRILDLTAAEMEKVGLIPDHADALHVASEVYAKAKELRGIDLTYCISPFVHHVRFTFKPIFLGGAEAILLDEAEQTMGIFDAEQELKAKWRKAFQQKHRDECFDMFCPICGGCETLVAQINEARLDDAVVSFRRGACVKCGLFIPARPYLADILLRDRIQQKTEEILKGYGIEEKSKT